MMAYTGCGGNSGHIICNCRITKTSKVAKRKLSSKYKPQVSLATFVRNARVTGVFMAQSYDTICQLEPLFMRLQLRLAFRSRHQLNTTESAAC